jgi:hypothetical protein
MVSVSVVVVVVCVCDALMEEEWGKGKGGFLIQQNVWKKEKKDWVLVL